MSQSDGTSLGVAISTEAERAKGFMLDHGSEFMVWLSMKGLAATVREIEEAHDGD